MSDKNFSIFRREMCLNTPILTRVSLARQSCLRSKLFHKGVFKIQCSKPNCWPLVQAIQCDGSNHEFETSRS